MCIRDRLDRRERLVPAVEEVDLGTQLTHRYRPEKIGHDIGGGVAGPLSGGWCAYQIDPACMRVFAFQLHENVRSSKPLNHTRVLDPRVASMVLVETL